jgi:hypothetical protein
MMSPALSAGLAQAVKAGAAWKNAKLSARNSPRMYLAAFSHQGQVE